MTDTAARPHNGRLPRSLRRKQLLAVALEVFAEHGYHAASMDEIAARAGVSKPVVYQHFPGKLDLYLALLESSVDSVVDEVRAALASTHDNRRRVQAAIALWFDFVEDRGQAFRLVSESDLTNDPNVRAQIDRFTRESADAIAEVISEDTGLPSGSAHLLAAGLVGICQTGARTWMDNGIAKDDAVRLMSGLAWRGIGGFPKPEHRNDQEVT
jgi:AcrR family transcriptional regulator